MSQPQPGYYDDLSETLAESWRLIARGVVDRRSAFHHPTVATIAEDGAPTLRTVILRGCDPATRQLRFHTDARSAKITELAANPRAALHFYDPGAKIQLRLSGHAVAHREGPVADAAWAGSRLFSRQCYGITPGPGTAIDAGAAFSLPDTSEIGTDPGRAHFTAVVLQVSALEWLYLAGQGHRRARFRFTDTGVESGWLAP